MKGNAYIPFMRRKGDGSTLNLDFTGGSLDSRVVLTRSAATATYINSSGYVATAVANEARFDYDPTTLTAKGLLIEGSATNNFYGSQSFALSGLSLNWFDNAILSRTSGNTDPANGSTAIGFNETLALDYHRINVYGILTGVVTISIFVKQINAARRFAINAGNYAGVSAIFDLTTGLQVGTTGGGASNKSASATAYPNGWFRFSVTGTYVADANIYFSICSSTSTDTTGANFTGTTNGGVYMWGAQLETGTSASSYIPTTTSQLTRNPDLALMTSTNFSSWYTGGTTGTFFVDFHGGVRGITSTVRSVISTTDLATKHLHLQQVSAAGALRVGDRNASPNYVTTANSLTSGARTKGAFSFAYPGTGTTSTVNLCLNGGTVATSSALLFSVAPTWLVLGATSTDGSTLTDLTTVLNGSIRQIKYYPTALTSAQLIAMTT